jgi:two-component system NtrC family sensor kinase
MIHSLINKIISFGTDKSDCQCCNRNIVMSNIINLTMFLITFFILLVESALYLFGKDLFSLGTYRIVFMALISLANLLLAKLGFTKLSKLSLTLFPVAIMAYLPMIFGFIRDDVMLYIPYGIMALSVIPHFIFSYQDQRTVYTISVLYYFALLLAFDLFIIKILSIELQVNQIIEQNLILYKLAQVAVFIFINVSVFYLRRRNTIYEEKLELQSKELEDSNKELKENKEELLVQNEELISYQDEINAKNEKLNKALSDLKAAQEKLVDSEKMASLGILTAGVAHEINNPVNYIYSGITAIESYLEENCEKEMEDLKPFLEAIDTGIDRTINIVKSLGRYSRSEDLPWSAVNMHQVIEDTLVMLFNQYKGRIEIQKNYDATDSAVSGNEGQLHQVLLNIMLNAIQAIPEKGVITVSTKNVNNDLILSVSDTGDGISKKELKHIFDPFFTTKEPGEGTGLGLSITKKIIQEHNGSIQVDSMLQKGTTFVIHLPLITEK